MENYTQTLTRFVLQTKTEDIPQNVIELAKKHFLDCVGAALAEAAEPRSQIVRRYFSALGADGDCRVVGHGTRLSVENAAFCNGILAHTICFDDSPPIRP